MLNILMHFQIQTTLFSAHLPGPQGESVNYYLPTTTPTMTLNENYIHLIFIEPTYRDLKMLYSFRSFRSYYAEIITS